MEVKTARPRVGLEVLVTVVPEGELPHLGKTTNLSTTGMLLEIGRELEVGGRVQVKLFLPGARKQFEIDGEVTRDAGATADTRSYGVHFVDVPPEIESAIERFLASRLASASKHQQPA